MLHSVPVLLYIHCHVGIQEEIEGIHTIFDHVTLINKLFLKITGYDVPFYCFSEIKVQESCVGVVWLFMRVDETISLMSESVLESCVP